MGGRHAAPQAHSTNVMCHVPAGTPTVPYARGGRPGRPSAPGVPGWLTAPTARPPWGGGPRAPAPTVPARRRRIAATGLTGLPRVWFPGGDFASTPGSAVVNPAEHPTSASTVESPSAPWNPPRPHSRHHQAPGSERPTRAKVVQTTPRAAPTGTSRTMGIAWGEARSGEIGPVRGCWRPPWPRPARGPRAGTPKARDGSPAMTDRVGGWGRNGFGHMVSSKNSGSVEPFFLPSNFRYPPPPTPLPILGSRVGGGITVL